MRLTLRQMNGVLCGVILVSGLLLLWGTVQTYRHLPPLPEAVLTTTGEVLFSQAEIRAGQRIFQRRNLMGFGTLLGNGSYFGPDFTAEYLALLRDQVGDQLAQRRFGQPLATLTAEQRAQVMVMVRANIRAARWQAQRVVVSPEWGDAHRHIIAVYHKRFVQGDPAFGVASRTLHPAEVAPLVAFIGWTAWFSLTPRPQSDGS